MKKDRIKEELEQIRRDGGGILQAEAVVEYAKDPTTTLHNCFTWDDTEAAHQYRLSQARRLIRVRVMESPVREMDPVRVYVSMKDDRKIKGGGYRHSIEVLSSQDMRERYLEQALEELTYFEKKYRHLKELSDVFDALDRVRAQIHGGSVVV